jgi:hypothetical protein
MKKITSIMLWVSLGLIVSSTTFAANNQKVFTPADKYGYSISIEQLTLPIQKIRNSLVEPYLEQVEFRVTFGEVLPEKPTYLKVWIIADNRNGYKIFFNQHTKKFGLAKYNVENSPYTSESLNVSNELTQVFMARN